MTQDLTQIEYDRKRIYENLDYQPEPPQYQSHIPWIVQQQIASTNGIHYTDRVGKLKDYPIYDMPVVPVQGDKLMLDIGNGWGRWLIAGANKGYLPIGMDIRLEFCITAKRVLKDLKKQGYAVVADLDDMPFQDSIFDMVWSYSVIQHTHYQRFTHCMEHINRILDAKGITCLEFPNKDGIRNRFGPVKHSEPHRDNFNSWAVRYYTPSEYRQIINNYLSDFSYDNHSFLGIGVLKEDLKYVSFKNKILCAISLALSKTTEVFPKLTDYADSIYVRATKKPIPQQPNNARATFYEQHKAHPTDNLNCIALLRCPKYGGDLTLSADRKRVLNLEAGIYYPIEQDIPILIKSEAGIM
jgi:ubiquinone/menaquinone biosynthesis C-methylase UbiE/uncharacterized protein YbaR (Trm112 family)